MGRRRSQERKNPPQIKLYTEGETEKIYFDALRSIVGIKGGISYSAKQVNKQGLNLFYYVKRCYTRHNFETSPVKIVLVIDKDNTSSEELTTLKSLCEENNYELVFCNKCFELWLLLHYERVTRTLDAKQLIDQLEHHLSKEYIKTDEKTITVISKSYAQALLNSDHMASIVNNFDINPYTNVNRFLRTFFDI